MQKRPNVVLAIVAALVIVIAVVAGVVNFTRDTPTIDSSTPDGTVQLFVQAIITEDDARAAELLDPSLGCAAPFVEVYRPPGVVLDVISVETSGSSASVVLDVTERDSPWNSWTHREYFDLVHSDSGWLITGAPWPVYACK